MKGLTFTVETNDRSFTASEGFIISDTTDIQRLMDDVMNDRLSFECTRKGIDVFRDDKMVGYFTIVNFVSMNS